MSFNIRIKVNYFNIQVRRILLSEDGLSDVTTPVGYKSVGLISGSSLKIIGKLGVSGTPEGIYSAGVGTIFINKTGSTSTTLFLKVSSSGNTGWVSK